MSRHPSGETSKRKDYFCEGFSGVTASDIDQHLEASVDHALHIERHIVWITHALKARILHDLGIHTVAMRARLEHDIRKHDFLSRLDIHLARKRHSKLHVLIVAGALLVV